MPVKVTVKYEWNIGRGHVIKIDDCAQQFCSNEHSDVSDSFN